ncbi:MAG TPA: hypothetical protein PLP05_06015 [Sedimentisphaerales bacterium]|nr:hypothetical protein [Sedimentisphaerales bacterium]
MNSFVTKLIVLAIIVIGLVVFVKFTSSTKQAIDEAQNPEKTFSDQVAEDDARLRALPDDVVTDSNEPVQKKETALEDANNKVAEAEPAVEEPQVEVVRKFKELDEIDRTEAERLFEVALTDRKIGRLPVTGYKLTVDTCRTIIERFPGSEFDYKARRLLFEIPERFRERYKLKAEEMDFESVGIVSEK